MKACRRGLLVLAFAAFGCSAGEPGMPEAGVRDWNQN